MLFAHMVVALVFAVAMLATVRARWLSDFSQTSLGAGMRCVLTRLCTNCTQRGHLTNAHRQQCSSKNV